MNKNSPFVWGHQRRFNAYAEYMKQRFGGRVQKISVDAGFNCPNRDGTIAYDGCSYCNNQAFTPSYRFDIHSINRQIDEGILFHARRYRRADKFLVYFQSYSNTHAELTTLRNIYQTALAHPKVIGLVIGTRPDTVTDEILAYLSQLCNDHYIMLEFGVESVYNQTLELVNRGHTFEQSFDTITKAVAKGIACGAHLIFGLPGETHEQMLEEASIISELPLTTIKFHQLQIYKSTKMAAEFSQHPENFLLFSLDAYIEFIINFTEKLNPAFVIERFAAEAPPKYLLSEPWGNLRYDAVLQMIEKRMAAHDSWQGKYYWTKS
jgi:uncharacterized protein